MITQNKILGDVALLWVTFFWGVSFPLVENAVKVVSPSVFVTLRFLLAALLLLPFLMRDWKHLTNKKIILPGLVLGVLNVIVYNAQSIGLETLSAAQSAFITGVSVVMVPFLLPFFRLGRPGRLDILSAMGCLGGLALLTGGSIYPLCFCCGIKYCVFAKNRHRMYVS